MEALSSINLVDLGYSIFTAFVAVFLVKLIRIFGELPTGMIGPDLNLLTYGFLWDTSIKAMRGDEYWPQFDESVWFFNKPTILVFIAIFNLLMLAWNLKLAHRIQQSIEDHNGETTADKFFRKPLVTAVGVTSLLAFLYISAAFK